MSALTEVERVEPIRELCFVRRCVADRDENPIHTEGTVMTSTDASVREFSFIKGVENVVAPKDGNIFQWNTAAARVREHLHDALNAKNLAFLFGSGCSSVVRDRKSVV